MISIFKYFQKNLNTYDDMKQKLTLSVDGNLIKLARMNHINLSELLTNILEGHDRVSYPSCASMSSNRITVHRFSFDRGNGLKLQLH